MTHTKDTRSRRTATGADPLSRYAQSEDFLNLERIDLSTLRVAFSADQGFAPVDNDYRPVFDRKIDAIRGMDITITTNAKDDREGRALLEAFNFPFKK